MNLLLNFLFTILAFIFIFMSDFHSLKYIVLVFLPHSTCCKLQNSSRMKETHLTRKRNNPPPFFLCLCVIEITDHQDFRNQNGGLNILHIAGFDAVCRWCVPSCIHRACERCRVLHRPVSGRQVPQGQTRPRERSIQSGMELTLTESE